MILNDKRKWKIRRADLGETGGMPANRLKELRKERKEGYHSA